MNGMERFWSKIEIGDWQECWLWTGATAGKGYGVIRISGKNVYVHRHVYELLVGPIPPGMEVDHVRSWGCRSNACVNPLHLEAVTPRENQLRSARVRARRTHCKHGHPYDVGNTRSTPRGRVCRRCERRRSLTR